MCLGLSETLIRTILDHGGDGIAFHCTSCRIGSPGPRSDGSDGDSSGALRQLHVTVTNLCKVVENLSSQVATLLSTQATRPATLSEEDQRAVIRDEVREMNERTKRKDSIIIRGSGATSGDGVKIKLKDVSRRLTGIEIVLDEVVCINPTTNLFRAKIFNSDHRNRLLEKSKDLAHHEDLKTMYISRDLTYKQREVLRERRRQRAEAPASQQANFS